jgi:hypothetical protein
VNAEGTRSRSGSQARLAQALRSLAGTVDRLSALSEREFQNPYRAAEWPASVDPEGAWFSSPELLSLYGTPFFEELDERARRRLSFHEAANFYSLNIHGEKTLMRGLAARLYRKDLIEVAPYLHHFLDEENKHSIYFGRFCTRYARIYPSRQPEFQQAERRDIDDFIFFAKVLIFEHIADYYNARQADDERLDQIARFINHNHHAEESRHLAFGRRLVAALWDACAPDWSESTKSTIRGDLEQFFIASWREYYNPGVYTDMRFADPWQVADMAWSADLQRDHRYKASRKCVRFLTSAGILEQEPRDVS